VKRGLIRWDESELPRAALDARLEAARALAAKLDVPAIVVYTDVWRSNVARSLVNFMPYWGRSLLVVPREDAPMLLCGNSPRVYPWLRTVTYVAELRPTKDLGAGLVDLARSERWRRIGMSDLSMLPYDIHRNLDGAEITLVDVSGEALSGADATELSMRRIGAEATRTIVESLVVDATARPERELVSRLERALRRGGMEDVVIRLADETSSPRPASGRAMKAASSVVVGTEYRGHWAHLSRPVGAPEPEARAAFVEALRSDAGAIVHRFDLSGPFPFRAVASGVPIEPGRLVAVHLELSPGRLYGDTCVSGPTGTATVL